MMIAIFLSIIFYILTILEGALMGVVVTWVVAIAVFRPAGGSILP